MVAYLQNLSTPSGTILDNYEKPVKSDLIKITNISVEIKGKNHWFKVKMLHNVTSIRKSYPHKIIKQYQRQQS